MPPPVGSDRLVKEVRLSIFSPVVLNDRKKIGIAHARQPRARE